MNQLTKNYNEAQSDASKAKKIFTKPLAQALLDADKENVDLVKYLSKKLKVSPSTIHTSLSNANFPNVYENMALELIKQFFEEG